MVTLQQLNARHWCKGSALSSPANDNARSGPTPHHLRVALILTWWEGELLRCMRRSSAKSDLAEAQKKVADLRSRIPADLLPEARAWVHNRDERSEHSIP